MPVEAPPTAVETSSPESSVDDSNEATAEPVTALEEISVLNESNVAEGVAKVSLGEFNLISVHDSTDGVVAVAVL